MKKAFALAVCAVSLLVASGVQLAQAQAYPSRPIRLILPFPPGGGTDILGRVIAQKLGESIGQNVIAENRPGAGGNVGAEYTVRQAPDGYTIVLCSPSISISPRNTPSRMKPSARTNASERRLVGRMLAATRWIERSSNAWSISAASASRMRPLPGSPSPSQ